MIAIISSGGKQYRTELGKVVEMELIEGNPGDHLTITDVVAVIGKDGIDFGTGKVVKAEIVKQFRDKKVRVFKKRQRTSGFEKSRGHRQYKTAVLIKEIN